MTPFTTSAQAEEGTRNLTLRTSNYIPDFIIFILEPLLIFLIIMSHPRMPSLAIAVFTIAKCLYTSHL